MTDTCDIDSDFNELPSESEINNMVNVFKAISDPTRLCILYLLKDTELCSYRIQEALNKPQPTISHHINILKNAGLINGRKKGTWIYFSLSNNKIIDMLEDLKLIF
ncbi:transcriptional regulator [Methanobrevibacter sp. 87.7]|uniref:ArsR/SmtB family transcription factor n=1 Tax=Methanobrevibacter sp. 87.7 TaxID=387957 RepID=UPI000B512BDC|nr:metalloregulator ArsR/SmtB family transcription factor [Methanobrevibacter sp. 87.7]OWT32956.1 transcriptional regulator [Methanobrevibacter sp. 87.7]